MVKDGQNEKHKGVWGETYLTPILSISYNIRRLFW